MQSEHLQQIVLARFQVNAAIFVAARLENGIFEAFYSILTTWNPTSQLLGVSKFDTQSEHLLQIVHAKFQVNVAIFAAARLEKVIFSAFYSILTA